MTVHPAIPEQVKGSHPPRQTAARQGHFTWIGILLTAGSLAAALWGIDIPSTAAALGRIDLRYILLALLSVLLTTAAKAARWRRLFPAEGAPSFRRAFTILNISLLLNTFAPARLGDLARVLFLGSPEATSKSFVLGTIIAEKASDLCGLVLGTAALLFVLPLPDWFAGPARGMVITALLLTGVLFFLAWQAGLLARLFHKLEAFPRLRWLLRDMTRALEQVRASRRQAISIQFILWTLAMPLLGASTNLLVFNALGLRLSFWAALFLLIVLMVGITAPSLPGRFGVFHYLTILALSPFGVDKAAGLACGIVLHLVVLLPTVILGGVYLWRERKIFSQMAASLLPRKGQNQEAAR